MSMTIVIANIIITCSFVPLKQAPPMVASEETEWPARKSALEATTETSFSSGATPTISEATPTSGQVAVQVLQPQKSDKDVKFSRWFFFFICSPPPTKLITHTHAHTTPTHTHTHAHTHTHTASLPPILMIILMSSQSRCGAVEQRSQCSSPPIVIPTTLRLDDPNSLSRPQRKSPHLSRPCPHWRLKVTRREMSYLRRRMWTCKFRSSTDFH